MAKSKAKSDKAGRNLDYCRYYRSTFRREKNKLIRVKKHLVRHPNDLCAVNCAKVLNAML